MTLRSLSDESQYPTNQEDLLIEKGTVMQNRGLLHVLAPY